MNRQQQIDTFLLEAHKLAVARLRAEPARLGDVSGQLARWREQAGPTRSDAYWDEWEALLDRGVGAVEQVACGTDDHSTLLRSVSPMSVLITQKERAQLLREARRLA